MDNIDLFKNFQKNFIDDLILQYKDLNEILSFVAEKPQKIRKIMRILNKNPRDYEKLVDAMKSDLLISCYTTAEKLLKEFIYYIIDFENHDNFFLNKFLDEKISRDKFSPNVKYDEVCKVAKRYFDNNNFILSKNNNEVKSYNYLISERHSYAHNNSFDYDVNKFLDAIYIIQYIYFELYDRIHGDEILLEVRDLSIKIKKIKKIESKENYMQIKNEIHHIKKLAQRISAKKVNENYNIEILKPVFEKIEVISKIDFRKINSKQALNNNISSLRKVIG